jgi:hypothetical protein
MLMNTWQRFTAGMKEYKKGQKKATGGVEGAGLEQEISTSGTIDQGDVKTLTGGIETPVTTDKPVEQTVTH